MTAAMEYLPLVEAKPFWAGGSIKVMLRFPGGEVRKVEDAYGRSVATPEVACRAVVRDVTHLVRTGMMSRPTRREWKRLYRRFASLPTAIRWGEFVEEHDSLDLHHYLSTALQWSEAKRRPCPSGTLASRYFIEVVKPTWLYAVSGPSGIKLGRTQNIDARMRGLASHWTAMGMQPEPLRLLGSVQEWVVDETTAHEQWAHLRTVGEWFRPTDELRKWIAMWPIMRRKGAAIARRVIALVFPDIYRPGSSRPYPLTALVKAEERAAVVARREALEARLEMGCPYCGGGISRQALQQGYCSPCKRALNDALLAKAEERVARATADLEEIYQRRQAISAKTNGGGR